MRQQKQQKQRNQHSKLSPGFVINFKEPKATEAMKLTLPKSQEGLTTLSERPREIGQTER